MLVKNVFISVLNIVLAFHSTINFYIGLDHLFANNDMILNFFLLFAGWRSNNPREWLHGRGCRPQRSITVNFKPYTSYA